MYAIALTLLLQAQPELPGEPSKTVHTVPLLTDAPAACVSLPTAQGVWMVLDEADITAMATVPSTPWKTEAERIQQVRAKQATSLLSAATEPRDALGCTVVTHTQDGQYAVLALFNQGRGRVWDTQAQVFLPAVERVEYNVDCRNGPFGTYTLRKPAGEEFIFIMSCIV